MDEGDRLRVTPSGLKGVTPSGLKGVTPVDPWRALPPRTLLAGTVALVIVVFLPAVGFDFVYDDHWTIVGNGFLRRPADWPLLFGHEAIRRHVPDAFRPISVLFDGITYLVFGLRPSWHHAVSIALHAIVTAATARWLGRLGQPVQIQIGTAAIFGTMAIHAEAIAVISYREDLLAAALGLAACLAAQRSLDRPCRLAWEATACALIALATGTKWSVVPLPFVWWLAQVHLQRRPSTRTVARLRGAAVLGLGVAIALAHRIATAGALNPYGVDPSRIMAHRIGIGPVLSASAHIHVAYAFRTLIPLGLRPEYVDFGAPWATLTTIAALGLLTSVLGLGIWAWRRGAPIAAFAILAAFALALPTSNLAAMPNMQADRFMYLPSLPIAIGLAAVCSILGERVVTHPTHPSARLVPLVAFVVLQGSIAQAALQPYRSDMRLWTVALRRAPASARAHAVLGELGIAMLRGRDDPPQDTSETADIAAHCGMALRLDPLDPTGYFCDAQLALLREDGDSAFRAFEAAEALSTQRLERASLGIAATLLTRTDLPYPERVQRSLEILDRVERDHPYIPEVFAVSARVHHRLGRPQDARVRYAVASSLHPERVDVLLEALELELDLGHAAGAARLWDQAEPRLRNRPPKLTSSLRRKLADAQRLFGPSTSHDPLIP